MDYFSFYGIPEAFFVDEQQVKATYYRLSREYHPDLYAAGDDEDKQAEALRLSTLNNQAFAVLSRFDKRLQYILDSHHLIQEGDKHNLSPVFLAEMMDMNESLMEMQLEADEAKVNGLKQELDAYSARINSAIQNLAKEYDLQPAEKTLLEIRDLYYQRKYLYRLYDRIAGIQDM